MVVARLQAKWKLCTSLLTGESESRIRALFRDAASAAPCIIFIGTHTCRCAGIE